MHRKAYYQNALFPKLHEALKRRVFIILLLAPVFFYSCKWFNAIKPDHPALTAKIIDSANRLANKDGLTLADKRSLNNALHFVDQQFSLIPNPGIGDLWNRYSFKQNAYLISARTNHSKNDLSLAVAYADSMLNIILSNHAERVYQNELGITYFAKGDVLFDEGYFQRAYRCFYQGKLLVYQSGNICNHNSFDNRFALLNYKENKFRQAASLFLQAYNDDKACNLDFPNFASTQGALDNAGLSYDHLGMVDSASACFHKALTYINQNAARFPQKGRFLMDARGVTYGYLGMIYQERGNQLDAKKWYTKSIRLNSYGGNERRNTQIIQLKLAGMYLETGRNRECDSLIKTIRTSLDTLPFERAEMEWQKLKWDYLSANRQPQQASVYLTTYLRMKDTADARERKLAIANAGNTFQQIQQGYELDILKKQNELNTLYLVITVGFSFMVILMVFQVYRSWKSSNRNNMELLALNHQVIEQNSSLQKTLTALEQSQEENTKMMQIVAHDIRNPIRGITSIAAMMLGEQDRHDNDKMRLELIKTSGQNSLELVSDLLQVHTKVEDLKKRPVDLANTLQYCIDLLHFKANSKGQQLNLKAESVIVLVNGEKIWRVISTLITNAIKFSPSGAIIDIGLHATAETAVITIEDHGIGIPDNMKDKVFDIFNESKRQETGAEQPFGFGLAISRQIIEAHGGKMWFESKADGGTIFYIELPRS